MHRRARSRAADHTDSVRFFTIERLLFSTPGEKSSLSGSAAIAKALADYYGVLRAPASDIVALPAPLRIDDPVESSLPRSPGLSSQITSRLRQYHLKFEVYYPVDFFEAQQIAAEKIAADIPVIALHPQPILLFGYDYRETEPLWWSQRFTQPGSSSIDMISLEDWRRHWWLWEPDPTASILFACPGNESTETESSDPQIVLSGLLTQARTDTAAGIVSYIRPVLDLQEMVKTADSCPEAVDPPIHPHDPLCLRQAAGQRAALRAYLLSFSNYVIDSLAGEDIRLAIYSADKASEEFYAASEELYPPGFLSEAEYKNLAKSSPRSPEYQIYCQRWLEHHLEAADHILEAVRWERQMLTALRGLVSAERPFDF